MIALLGLLARLSVILGFAGVAFASISDLLMRTNYLTMVDSMVDLGSTKVKIVLGLLAIIYLVIFLLSYINRLTKYSNNRKVKNKSGEIEVTIKTINEVAKDFLASQEIIKNSKIKSYPSGKAVVIEAVVDTYSVDNLKDKLTKIQEKLSEHVFNSTGITVKKSKVNLKKVLGETIVEKKIIDEPVNIKENKIKKEEHVEFLTSYVNDIIENEDILVEKIKEILDGWTYERLGTLEKVLLKISFYEITIKEVGYEIAINEAVELAKKYSYDDTKEFLNGILAKLVKQNNA